MARKPKTVYERNRRDAKELQREARVGDVLYVVVETADPYKGYDEAHYYSRYKVTHMHPLLGGGMIGSLSVEGLVLNFGPVYTEQPSGILGVHEEKKDTFHPYGGDNNRVMALNAGAARELAQLAAEIRNR
jgi:hypothetical protein